MTLTGDILTELNCAHCTFDLCWQKNYVVELALAEMEQAQLVALGSLVDDLEAAS